MWGHVKCCITSSAFYYPCTALTSGPPPAAFFLALLSFLNRCRFSSGVSPRITWKRHDPPHQQPPEKHIHPARSTKSARDIHDYISLSCEVGRQGLEMHIYIYVVVLRNAPQQGVHSLRRRADLHARLRQQTNNITLTHMRKEMRLKTLNKHRVSVSRTLCEF